MPRTKLDTCADPPIDWLRAAVLERMSVKGLTRKELAKIAHVGYGTMRQYITMSPWDWPEDVRRNVCAKLGIRPLRGVYGMPEE